MPSSRLVNRKIANLLRFKEVFSTSISRISKRPWRQGADGRRSRARDNPLSLWRCKREDAHKLRSRSLGRQLIHCQYCARLAARPLFWHSSVSSHEADGTIMDKTELRKLQAFVRHAFDNEGIRVSLDPKDIEAAVVTFGERQIGKIIVDDEDGDRSFSLEMKLPVGREVLQEYLRRLFETEKLTIAARMKKNDSVELNNGEDFLGIISADDPKGKSYTLQIAILDFDLEDF